MALPVNETNPVFRYTPNRTVTWSRFPDFSMQNEVHVNNAGFVNDQDYVAESTLPLIAVVGDSYVEALMVPYNDTLHGRLSKKLNGTSRVYSFALSGMPLSQYLAYATYARDTYHPEKYIIVVVGNDFDESLVKYVSTPGVHQFKMVDGELELVRNDYYPSKIRTLLRSSRFFRYLYMNCSIVELMHNVREISKSIFANNSDAEVKYVGNTLAKADLQLLADSKNVVDEFLSRLPEATGVAIDEILIVLDGLRPSLYTSASIDQDSYFGIMRTYMKKQAQLQGIPLIDMQGVFVQDYAKNSLLFEFPKDGHWNARSHGLAATAVIQSGFLSSLRVDQ